MSSDASIAATSLLNSSIVRDDKARLMEFRFASSSSYSSEVIASWLRLAAWRATFLGFVRANPVKGPLRFYAGLLICSKPGGINVSKHASFVVVDGKDPERLPRFVVLGGLPYAKNCGAWRTARIDAPLQSLSEYTARAPPHGYGVCSARLISDPFEGYPGKVTFVEEFNRVVRGTWARPELHELVRQIPA